MQSSHEIQFRVRYNETDAQGFVHHANYAVWFEMGRVELLRSQGHDYRKMEESGRFFVVAKLSVRFKSPAHYDDLLTLRTALTHKGFAKLDHLYELFRDGKLLAIGETTLACIDRQGQIHPIPPTL